jgi:hypothetical protein
MMAEKTTPIGSPGVEANLRHYRESPLAQNNFVLEQLARSHEEGGSLRNIEIKKLPEAGSVRKRNSAIITMEGAQNMRSMLMVDEPRNSERERREIRPRQAWGPTYGQKSQPIGSQSMFFDPKGPENKPNAGFKHFPYAVSKN